MYSIVYYLLIEFIHTRFMRKNLEHTVGIRVRTAREAAGVTKSRFCLMADISRPYLDKIKSGRANISLKMLAKLAACLEVDPIDLLR